MDPQSTPSPALSTGARTPAPRKHTPRVVAERTEELAHLSLDGLREYRKALTHEEGNVSYWRRIIQARLDLVRQGTDAASANLRPVLTDKRVGAGRQALVQIVPVDDIPPLPDLAGLWAQQVDPADTVALADLEVRLAAAEAQLSEYRAALHLRLAASTNELIARYRDEPALALTALPVQPARRRTVPA